jgi:hypothetical protein
MPWDCDAFTKLVNSGDVDGFLERLADQLEREGPIEFASRVASSSFAKVSVGDQ